MHVVIDDRGGIRVLRLDRPPVNALDVATLEELASALEASAEDDDVNGIVLTGTGSVMSAGADLVKVLDGGDEYVDAGIDALTRTFRALFTAPKPIVAAVNGHALAGGAVLTCGCDHRVMGANAGRIGAIELAAGVPFPAWALILVKHGVNNHKLDEVLLFGRAYEPADAFERGLIDEVVADELVVDTAIERAAELARAPAKSFALTKRSLRASAVAEAERLAVYDDEVKAAWRSQEVQDAVRRQVEALRRS